MLKLETDKVKILLCHGVDTEVIEDAWSYHVVNYHSVYIACGNTDDVKVDTLARTADTCMNL